MNLLHCRRYPRKVQAAELWAAHVSYQRCLRGTSDYWVNDAIDQLQEYSIEEFPDTEMVVNPAWRELDRQRNSLNNKLRHRRAKFGQLAQHAESKQNEKRYSRWLI